MDGGILLQRFDHAAEACLGTCLRKLARMAG
jgi:hypothetical protein